MRNLRGKLARICFPKSSGKPDSSEIENLLNLKPQTRFIEFFYSQELVLCVSTSTVFVFLPGPNFPEGPEQKHINTISMYQEKFFQLHVVQRLLCVIVVYPEHTRLLFLELLL